MLAADHLATRLDLKPCFIESIHGRFVETLKQMPVHVECGADAGMPEAPCWIVRLRV